MYIPFFRKKQSGSYLMITALSTMVIIPTLIITTDLVSYQMQKTRLEKTAEKILAGTGTLAEDTIVERAQNVRSNLIFQNYINTLPPQELLVGGFSASQCSGVQYYSKAMSDPRAYLDNYDRGVLLAKDISSVPPISPSARPFTWTVIPDDPNAVYYRERTLFLNGYYRTGRGIYQPPVDSNNANSIKLPSLYSLGLIYNGGSFPYYRFIDEVSDRCGRSGVSTNFETYVKESGYPRTFVLQNVCTSFSVTGSCKQFQNFIVSSPPYTPNANGTILNNQTLLQLLDTNLKAAVNNELVNVGDKTEIGQGGDKNTFEFVTPPDPVVIGSVSPSCEHGEAKITAMLNFEVKYKPILLNSGWGFGNFDSIKVEKKFVFDLCPPK